MSVVEITGFLFFTLKLLVTLSNINLRQVPLNSSEDFTERLL